MNAEEFNINDYRLTIEDSHLLQPRTARLAEALAKAKAKFKVAAQTGRNTFFKTPRHPDGAPYSTVQDVDAAISDALTSEGFAPVTVHPMQEGGEWIAKGVLRHKSGESISACVPMLVQKRDMQGWKSALTYAQRMLIVCLTGCVSGESDDDANAAVEPPKGASAEKTDRSRQIAAGMTAEAELRKAIDAGDEAAATKALAKVQLRAKRKEIDAGLAQRAQAAFDKAFEKEVVNV